MEFQKTIKKKGNLEGVGLHTGNEVKVAFKPAPQDSGINFIRIDLPEKPKILAHISNVIDLARSPRRTSIGCGNVEVHTIEHLMATLSALGIDNIVVEIDGDEVPGLDGSATPFVEVLKRAGIVELDAPKKPFQIKEAVWVEDPNATLAILPGNKPEISYALSYEHPFLKAEYLRLPLDRETFEKEIAPSRTFCLEREVEELRKQGLGKGADYENTLVVGKKGVVDNKLRFEDEFVRHKVLDLIGDLYLLGCPLIGHVIAVKSGHPVNIRLLQKLEQQKTRLKAGGVKGVYAPVDETQLDVNQVMKILPHRYPFLFLDRIVELEPGKRAVGIKNVTINDSFFAGHFPGRPVMPGVLIVEAMAQVAGVLMLSREESLGKLAYFMSADKVKFRKTVVPGDQLRLTVEVVKLRSKTGQVHTEAWVEGKVVAEADLMFSLVEA